VSASGLENKFALLWRALNGPNLTPEHRFHPERKWRFDFALPAARVAIECQGGTFARQRLGHSSGTGIQRDYEKLNAAQLSGWTVFQLTGRMLTIKEVQPMIDFCREILAAETNQEKP